MRLILVRHPKPRCEPGLCYGRLDLECEAQALETAVSRLRDLAAAACVFSSPARRAFDLASRLDPGATADPRLQELDFGDWEGRRWQDSGPRSHRCMAARPAGFLAAEWGNADRDGGAMRGLARDLEGGERPILAITHAGPIRLIRATIEGEPLLTYFTAAVPFAEPIELRLSRPQSIGRPSLQPAARG